MNNPPAFPTNGDANWNKGSDGMTLRDYFAAQAIGSIYRQSIGKNLGSDYMANCAYILADAMLKARENV